jgi:glycolate oxidase iron-sulfur subunit
VRCGFCLPACPTYKELAVETSSPRGRIALMKAVTQGRLGLASAGFVHQMYECLGCRACEAVCPSGVQYGAILEDSRDQIERQTPRPWWVRLVRLIVFAGLFRDMRSFRAVAGVMRSPAQRAQRDPGDRAVRRLGLAEMEALLPVMDRRLSCRAARPRAGTVG